MPYTGRMGEKLIILLAEDDPNDATLMEMAFRKNGLRLPVHVCTNGEDAMNYPRGRAATRTGVSIHSRGC